MTNYEFRVFAMKRSGHHAVMNWLKGHFSGETLFLNTSFHKGRCRFLRQEETDKLGHNLDCLCYHVLDCIQEGNRPDIPLSDRFYNILVVRDPFNAFASRCKYCTLHQHRAAPSYETMPCGNKRLLRMGCIPTEADGPLRDVWISFAKEALCDTHILQNRVFINFNKWFGDIEYRMQISRNLGLVFNDAGINTVPEFGDGSSFDGTAFNGQAQNMNVLNRWRDFVHYEWFRAFFTDEVLDLSNRLGYGNIVTDYLRMKP